MKFFSIIFSLLIILTSSQTLSQSLSNSSENLFTEGSKNINNNAEELVDGMEEALSETKNAIEKTVNELSEEIEEEMNNTAETIENVSTPAKAANENNQETSGKLENTIILTLNSGPVIIELKPEVAPNHVARIKQLTRDGFYDGVVFHRVIDGFMAQTGDPDGTGRGGSGQKLEAEFNDEEHIRGTVSMARAADPNSGDSQFFIMFEEAPHLDGNYTVFGQVTSGMELVDGIKKGFGPNGMVSEPDSILTVKVAADVDEENLPAVLKNGGDNATPEDATPVPAEAETDTAS